MSAPPSDIARYLDNMLPALRTLLEVAEHHGAAHRFREARTMFQELSNTADTVAVVLGSVTQSHTTQMPLQEHVAWPHP